MRPAILLLIIVFISCSADQEENLKTPYIMVLGIAQDAGYPQMNCTKSCCKIAWENSKLQRMTSCLAIIDPTTKEQWIIDATPNFKNQLQLLKSKTGTEKLDGILLTHAHIGHYTGLMHLGREAIGAKEVPVFAMPKMSSFLKQNGPWSQLINLENISLKKLAADSIVYLNKNIQIKPFLVPHRDEFSETVGYKIVINNKALIFIPDIDKWGKWENSITQIIQKVDYAFLDATFYKNGELKRDMSEIPHPFVEESIELFSTLSKKDRRKVYFIHFNHTNPLLIEKSSAQKDVLGKGFNLATEGEIIKF
ncbi:MAG: pyrroloquinoline quinone biosynthesis protein PqqB [Flavobacteriales bacterium]|nr:pyrroloquinoline quinone biosynthesis protein PqqB [Flavobacteriales bacterium]|tara:strand:- start:27300 stop:28223 length:924 start_codon:yes stop_codon:yes gene_type:complete